MSDKEEDSFIPAEQEFSDNDGASGDSSSEASYHEAIDDINNIFRDEEPEIILDYTNNEDLARDIKEQEAKLKKTSSELRESLFPENVRHPNHPKQEPIGYGKSTHNTSEPTVNPNTGRLTLGKAGGWIFAWLLLGGIFVGTSISQHNEEADRKSWDELMADLNTDPENSIDTYFTYVMDESGVTPVNTVPSEQTNQKPDLTYSNYYTTGDRSNIGFEIRETNLEISGEEGRYLVIDYYDLDGGNDFEIVSEAFTTVQGNVDADYPYDVVFDISDVENSGTLQALDELGMEYVVEPTFSYNSYVVLPIEEVLRKDFS